MKSLALSLFLASACAFGGVATAQAADMDVTPRLPHVTRGPAIPQYVQRYVVQQGLPDEGPLTLLDGPYSSSAYPYEYAGPGYAYAPVYGPFYGTGYPFALRGGRVGAMHGHGGWRGAFRGGPRPMRTAAVRPHAAPRMMSAPARHR